MPIPFREARAQPQRTFRRNCSPPVPPPRFQAARVSPLAERTTPARQAPGARCGSARISGLIAPLGQPHRAARAAPAAAALLAGPIGDGATGTPSCMARNARAAGCSGFSRCMWGLSELFCIRGNHYSDSETLLACDQHVAFPSERSRDRNLSTTECSVQRLSAPASQSTAQLWHSMELLHSLSPIDLHPQQPQT